MTAEGVAFPRSGKKGSGESSQNHRHTWDFWPKLLDVAMLFEILSHTIPKSNHKKYVYITFWNTHKYKWKLVKSRFLINIISKHCFYRALLAPGFGVAFSFGWFTVTAISPWLLWQTCLRMMNMVQRSKQVQISWLWPTRPFLISRPRLQPGSALNSWMISFLVNIVTILWFETSGNLIC